MTPWQAPWRPGATLEACLACGDRCVASTLEDGRCAACRAAGRQAAPTPLEGLEPAQTELDLP